MERFNRSFWTILGIGLALRLIAAVFSYGYGMHDDHFVIEDGPYRWELPNHGGWFDREGPPGHSVVYPATLYGILQAESAIGITDPMDQMLGMRLLHAVWSMLALPFIWLLADRFGGQRAAVWAGLLFAVLWVLPFMSVRNLIEMVAIPPLMAGWWFAVRRRSTFDLLLAALGFGAAFCFRYHTALVPVGMVLGYLLQREYRPALILAALVPAAAVVLQGTADMMAWGYPLAGPIAYVSSNLRYDPTVPQGAFWVYPVLLIGVFLPPMSLFFAWWAGRHRDRESLFLVLLPVLLFVAIHMAISNQQERFVLPIMGAITVLFGVAIARRRQWLELQVRSTQQWTWVVSAFFVINSLLLVPMTIAPTKSARVDAMYRLRSLPERGKVVSIAHPLVFTPRFYAGHDVSVTPVSQEDSSRIDTLLAAWDVSHVVCMGTEARSALRQWHEQRSEVTLALVDSIVPKGLDQLLYQMNPRGNRNETSYIYAIGR